jgi:hypothetical protein
VEDGVVVVRKKRETGKGGKINNLITMHSQSHLTGFQ